MPIKTTELANVVLANLQHMDTLKMISKSYPNYFKMYEDPAKVSYIAKSQIAVCFLMYQKIVTTSGIPLFWGRDNFWWFIKT